MYNAATLQIGPDVRAHMRARAHKWDHPVTPLQTTYLYEAVANNLIRLNTEIRNYPCVLWCR